MPTVALLLIGMPVLFIWIMILLDKDEQNHKMRKRRLTYFENKLPDLREYDTEERMSELKRVHL